jgi:DNA polymerase elongation subunit (family B)
MTALLSTYDFVEDEDFNADGVQETQLRIWGLDTQNVAKVVTIKGFKPWCFVELPKTLCLGTRKTAWTDSLIASFISELRDKEFASNANEIIHVKRSKFYYFQPVRNSFHMLKVFFLSAEHMRTFSRKLENAARIPTGENARPRGFYYGPQFGRIVLRVWEGDNAISTARKFMTLTNCDFAGWMSVVPTTVVEPSETTKFTCVELIVEPPPKARARAKDSEEFFKRAIKPHDDEPPPATAPRILAFDIEAYSSNHLAMPNALNRTHSAYMISCVFQRAREPSSRKRILIATEEASVATNPNHHAYESTKTRVDEFIIVEKESDMLVAFGNLVARLDPDILTGYNTHGFDYKYLDTRYRLLVDPDGGWPSTFARNRTSINLIKSRKWKSSNYGYTETHTLSMEGRISVDLMPIVKRDYGRLSKYTLDFVSKHFLGETTGKHSVTPKQMFIAFEKACTTRADVASNKMSERDTARVAAIDEMTRVAAYAIQDSELVIDLIEKLNIWIGLVELSFVSNVPLCDTFARGQQCRIVSLLYNIASREDVVLDRRKLPGSPGLAGGDGAQDDDSIIKFTGAFVGESVTGLHDNVICLDFASLYPSIMIAYNISPDTLVLNTTPLEAKAFTGKVEAADKAIAEKTKQFLSAADENKTALAAYSVPDTVERHTIAFVEGIGTGPESESDEENPKKANEVDEEIEICIGEKYAFEFTKAEVRRGLLPRLVADLVAARKTVRKQMYEIESAGEGLTPEEEKARQLKLNVLNQRQLAFKVTANSTYGFIGAQRGGMFPLVEGAMSVTAKGRQLIQGVSKFLIDTYQGRILGGDTDSVFCQLPDHIKAARDCSYWGNRLAKETTDHINMPPLRLEFEKAMRVIYLAKKKYAAYLINDDGSFETKKLVRGITLARRDNCQVIRDLYERVLTCVLDKHPPTEAFKISLGAIANTFRVSETPDDVNFVDGFEIVKSLGADYKQATFQMAVFGEECAKAGRPASPGDRLGFIIVKTPSSIPPPGSALKADNLGLHMRLTDLWKELWSSGNTVAAGELDVLYYLGHMFMNPIDQLFSVAYGKSLEEVGVSREFAFIPRKNVSYSCTTPLKMLTALIRNTNSTRARKGQPPLSNAAMAKICDEMVSKFEEIVSRCTTKY